MRSMTGYGRGAATREGWEIAVQASSLNRKTLEVSLSLPREWQVLEPELTALVRERVSRGRIQVSIEVRGAAPVGMAWDDVAVDAVLERLAATAARRGLPFVPSSELIFQVAAANRCDTPTLETSTALGLLREALGMALTELVAMRAREGDALATDLGTRVGTLRRLVDAIAARVRGTTGNYRDALLQRLRQIGLELDLNDERVLKEIALFADRIDISEELTRLGSHLEHLEQLLHESEPIGRKAEFLLQEIGREIHTVGSKANDLEVARAVIDFKNEVERIREQVQNVE